MSSTSFTTFCWYTYRRREGGREGGRESRTLCWYVHLQVLVSHPPSLPPSLPHLCMQLVAGREPGQGGADVFGPKDDLVGGFSHVFVVFHPFG